MTTTTVTVRIPGYPELTHKSELTGYEQRNSKGELYREGRRADNGLFEMIPITSIESIPPIDTDWHNAITATTDRVLAEGGQPAGTPTEHLFSNENDAHVVRRSMINDGWECSLIAPDPARGDLFVFDSYSAK